MSRNRKGNPAREAPARVLCVAGSDSAGCAGIAADARTVAALGCHPLLAVTAVTAQDARAVRASAAVPPAVVTAQIEAGLSVGVAAVKIGMLAGARVARAVADALGRGRAGQVVLDPVLRSTSGTDLLDGPGRRLLLERLVPLAALVTPNAPEAEALTGRRVDGPDGMAEAAWALLELGAGAVLVKGGHLEGAEAVDLFAEASGGVFLLRSPRLPGRHTRGTGCILSSAIASHLARGLGLPAAVLAGKRFVSAAIAAGYPLGRGRGPANPSAGGRSSCR